MSEVAKKAVIIFGPPGSGKGTQAELLSKKRSFIHFDTGRYLENLVHSPELQKNKIIRQQRELFDSGKLCDIHWALKIVRRATQKIAEAGFSIVYSGSPRSMFEAFGDKNHQGLMAILDHYYGKKNITIIKLNVPPLISLKRNSHRLICSFCGLPLLAAAKIKTCAFCGAKMRKRTLDKPEIIKIRLGEYRQQTFPLLQKLKQKGYKIKEVDGKQRPYEIAQKISQLI